MYSYKCETTYNGTRYNGWQKQGNTSSTIQGKIEDTLSRMLNEPIEITGSGRTDAGVHADVQPCEQLGSFDAGSGIFSNRGAFG